MPAKYFVAKPEPIEYPEGPDGPQICNLKTAEGKREYYSRIRLMAYRQGELCAICNEFMVAPTFDHERTRRLGQDDRTEYMDGRWKNAAVCYTCNMQKGSRRYHWLNGKYVAVEREVLCG